MEEMGVGGRSRVTGRGVTQPALQKTVHPPWESSIPPLNKWSFGICRGAEGKLSAGKWQSSPQSTGGTHNSLAKEQAHDTKPSFQPQPWSSCLPVPPSICITIHGRSGAAPQPNSWPLAKWIISPFCPHVWLAPFAYSSFFPHPGISCAGNSRCSRLSLSPAIQFVRVYKYPGEENGNRSTGTEPSL